MTVDLDALLDAVRRDDGTGICTACGSEQAYVEPDAEHVRCENCGQRKVYGAEQLLLRTVA